MTESGRHGVDLDVVRIRLNPATRRIEACQPDGPDVYIRSVAFPVGQEPTLSEIIRAISGDDPAHWAASAHEAANEA